nr:hypothetical protein [Tanacetum cinerariifolium]
MIVDSIENGPYVRRMIATPGEPDLPVLVFKSFHEQTDEELTEMDIKRMDVDDQAIQTILLGLSEDVYAAVDSCEIAKEIWERVRKMMKGSDIGEQEKMAKLFNEWEKFTYTDGESIESYYHRFMQLMNDLKRNKHFPENIASNLKFLNHLQPEWKRHVTIVRQTKNLHETDFTQICDFLKMNQEEVNELRAERLAKSHDPMVGFKVLRMRVCKVVEIRMGWLLFQGLQTRVELEMLLPLGLRVLEMGIKPGIQLQAEEFDFMAAAGDLDEIEEVNANCILMANLQQASTSGTQHDKAPVYDTDGSAEVHTNDNCYDNEIFNMVTQVEQYTDLLEPIPEPQLVPQNKNHVTSVAPKKSSISSLMDEKKRLKHDFKIREDKFLDKEVDLEARIKDLENILLKRDQTVQTMHMFNPKPDSFYHPNQKMALGYPNSLYLKKVQMKQHSLYNGKLLLEEHGPPVVYDLKETLELAQESRRKMRLLKKEIKPANYAKINHLLWVFVPQTTKSKEELFLSNVSNMVTVSKMISIPNEDLSDDTTPSVA